MKIAALIKKLQKLNPNLDIILSSDSEGNCYKELDFLESCLYVKTYDEDSEFGKIYGELELGESPQDFDSQYHTKPKSCAVLYPK